MKKPLHFFILFFCFSPAIYAQQNSTNVQQRIDSMLSVLSTIKEDTSKIKLFNSLSVQSMLISSYDSSLKYSTTAIQLADNILKNTVSPRIIISAKKGQIEGYSSMGRIYYMKDLYSISIDAYFTSLKIAEEIHDTNRITQTLRNIGDVYLKKGDYQKNLDYSFRALDIEKKRNNKIAIADYTANLGIAYQTKGDYEKALEYYFEALKMGQETGNENRVAAMTGCIGMTYKAQALISPGTEKEDYLTKSLDYLYKAMKKSEERNNTYGKAIWMGHIGDAYRMKGDYQKAEEHYLSTLNLNEEDHVINGVAVWNGKIGSLYTEMIPLANGTNEKQRLFVQAEKHLLKSIILSDSLGTWNNKMNFELAASELYAAMNKHKEALEHYKKAMTAKDTLFNQEKENQITRKEDSYEFEKKISAAKAEHDLENEKNEKEKIVEQNKRYWSVGISSLLLITMAGGGFTFYKNRQNKNKILLQKSELEKKLIENDFLRSRMNPHFVSNALDTLNNLVAQGKNKLAQEYLERLDKLMRWILNNSSRELVTLEQELEMLNNYLVLEKPGIENGLDWVINVTDNIDADSIELPPLILQPLVENAIKHGIENITRQGMITISVSKENDRIACIIEDNGYGIAPGQMDKSDSKGIKLVRERLNLFSKLNKADAQFNFMASEQGTRVSITFTA